ncbi:bifunctional 5,10-methylenetetrahydrofolate dehydrogenase/5,10-methenyltetrahydrofolate cyclohydrolase [Paenibacillus sp. IITD108]|uniref:bifunctional 5,10-methylenetetrahydrofolate dehydrogenase/5,10-methenyltetrahydrofolate cyclohydrolase n=1 Tax=Paenibacillus sp. IITD108 TaxID=3116649 RepID=UPI002F3E44CB
MTLLMKAKDAAEQMYERMKTQVEQLQRENINPQMAVILVEGDPASLYYAQAKHKLASKLGVQFILHTLAANTAEAALLQFIHELNMDTNVHGIMVELPLPKQISTAAVEAAIAPMKDIDGVTPANKLATMTGAPGLYPATPQACIMLLKHYGYSLYGKNVTLVGRGQTVGMPLFHMLQRENATVTVCHSHTADLASHLAKADIAFVAVGKARMIVPALVHSKLVIIDAGINENSDGKMAGDVAKETADCVEAMSPVPGGVGTLTTAILFNNLMQAVMLQQQEAESNE